ncbi:MAG: iron-sulfur cluster assembly accessory protein, partial [Verrucomicrobia bacterium]|nr:iron-sulfur cluster assembly accessory protein [Verrucomicrobiota bacterium]
MISGIAKKETPTEAKVRVGDERLLKVSEEAGNKVRSLLERQGRPGGVLRVAVVGGGCSGLQYKLDLQDT